ncbi:MAG: GGDEF domain-containing protein [Acetatifactor sp.]|nr:GGDEF domain-containing protein [Acetatifactor sp.]
MKSMGRIFYGMLLVTVLMFLLTISVNSRDVTSQKVIVRSDYEQEIGADGKQYITIEQPVFGGDEKEGDLVFFTSHHYVRVFADDEEIYSVLEDYGRLGHTPGNIWNFVRVPFGTGKIVVELTKVYDSMNYENYVFYLGDELEVFDYIYGKAVVLAGVGTVIVLLGILMVGYSFILNWKVKSNSIMMPLGIFSLVLGIWSCNETNTVVLLFPYRSAASTLAYLSLELMPIPFLMFTRAFLDIRENRIWKLIGIGNAISFGTSIGLQLLDIKDLKETVVGSHIILGCTILYIIAYLCKQFFFGERTRKLKSYIYSMIAIVLGMGVEIFLYYTGSGTDVGTFGRFGFLGFVLLLGIESTEETNRMLNEARRMEVYKEMATKDWLTGLGSRNAFAMKEENLKSLDNVGVFVFDLNNLKQCNDRFGHAAGDRYLRLAAECIHEVFQPYGDCFRIGGDEFCCLVTDWAACPVEDVLQNMRAEENKVNQESGIPVQIQIACGYAVYDDTVDINLKATRNRADEMMYRNKVDIKKI